MKNTATKLFLLSIVLFCSVLGVFAQRGQLVNAEWKLSEAYGTTAPRWTTAQLNINDSGDRFTGSTGCNQMFGSLSLRGNRILFGAIGTTKRACKMIAGSIPEETFLRGMNAATRYRVDGRELSLFDRRGRTVLKFRRFEKDPGNGAGTVELEDKKWMLESIGNRRTFAPITGVSMIFDPSRDSVGGDSGCNVYGGNYSVNRRTIAIKNVISTMRACIEDGKMQTERELFDGLKRANKFDISGNRLRLYRGSELLLTFRGERK